MQILNGREIADRILDELASRIDSIRQAGGLIQSLAIIVVGEDRATGIYVKNKLKSAARIGLPAFKVGLSEAVTDHELLTTIEQLNSDANVAGIIVQLPLPKHINKDIILLAISPNKDVDGFHPLNVGCLHTSCQKGFIPCTALGCLQLIKECEPNLQGKNAVIIGRSNIVGKPLAALLLSQDCTVTICHSNTVNLARITKAADIVVSAVGKPRWLSSEYFNSDCIVIDVGINPIDDNNIVGDVDFENVYNKVRYITPVPGGVGPMTVAFLLKNTVTAVINTNKNF